MDGALGHRRDLHRGGGSACHRQLRRVVHDCTIDEGVALAGRVRRDGGCLVQDHDDRPLGVGRRRVGRFRRGRGLLARRPWRGRSRSSGRRSARTSRRRVTSSMGPPRRCPRVELSSCPMRSKRSIPRRWTSAGTISTISFGTVVWRRRPWLWRFFCRSALGSEPPELEQRGRCPRSPQAPGRPAPGLSRAGFRSRRLCGRAHFQRCPSRRANSPRGQASAARARRARRRSAGSQSRARESVRPASRCAP